MVKKDTAVHCVGAESKISIPRKAFSQSEYRTHSLVFVGDSIIRKKTFWRYLSFSWDTHQKWNCQWEKLFKQGKWFRSYFNNCGQLSLGVEETWPTDPEPSWDLFTRTEKQVTWSNFLGCFELSMCDASNVSSVSDVHSYE